MATILYEHPLNERIRNYLRLEHLFVQVHNCAPENIAINHQVFFGSLFAIVDILERSDIRGELIKDLEKLEQNLVIWSQSPEINNNALQDNLQQSINLTCLLKVNTPKWWQLKEDKLLAGLKQRFAIQGGSANFDLPQLQFWINQPIDIISHDISDWLEQLSEVENALSLVLKFIRQRASFEKITCDSGFYQDNGEGLILLRIKVDRKEKFYPTISGNKFRYSIRFMLPCKKLGKKQSNQPTEFELARC